MASQRGEDFSFALKTSEPIVVSPERGRKDLDRDLTLQLLVGRPIHLPHPALADLRGDFVDAEARARTEGQTAGSIAVSVVRTRSLLCNAAVASDSSLRFRSPSATCQDLSRQEEPWKMALWGISADSNR